jgi:tRNA nucleotidyltransferase (CCA-adding enzyme)
VHDACRGLGLGIADRLGVPMVRAAFAIPALRVIGRMELDPPAAVRAIARRLEDAGFETWAVGGVVRDAVLGQPTKDWDLATRAHPRKVRKLFRRTVPLGIDHGTVGVIGSDDVLYEVTTFRRDVETFGRHAVVEFAETVDEDLSRRDFTCNALAWHPLSGELRDPFGGLEDLRRGLIRTVGRAGDRFAEDYLRVLRALRFAGQLQFEIEPDTWSALVSATPQLPRLSAERVREELWKVLSNIRVSSRALALYSTSGALRVLYPEMDRLVGLDQSPRHPLDAWNESLLSVDAVPPSRPLLRVAVWLHGVGKPAARTRDLRGGWRFTGHEASGARIAEDMLRRLKFSNAQTARVARLIRLQSELFPPDAPDAVVRRWLHHIGLDIVDDLLRLRFALWRARATQPDCPPPDDLLRRAATIRRVVHARPPLTIGDLAISGDDLAELGLRPGPQFGEILRALLDRVLDRPELNRPETLLSLVAEELLR